MNIQLSDNFNYRKLIKFTLPTIFMMIFTSIYGMVDGLVVSNIVGSNAFAAVNIVLPVVMMTSSIGFMFGSGGGALVSKTMGEGDNKRANEIFSMIVYLLIIIGCVFSIIGFIFIKPLCILLGADNIIMNDCIIYGRVLFISLVPFLLQICFQSFLVVAEKPTMGLIISIAAGITNIILDILFVYMFKMGILGAAVATLSSEVVGGIIPLIYFLSKNNSSLRLIKHKFELTPIVKSCINGSSEMFSNLSMSIVNMLYNLQLIKLAGNDGVVAYGILMYISFIFSSIYIGYSMGITPVIGYHYGANNKDELRSLLKKSIVLITLSSLTLTLVAEFSARFLAKVFISYDKDLLNMTIHAIKICSLSYIFSGFNIFASAFFTGLNNGFVSAIISFLRTFVFEITMIFVLPIIFGLNGIWSSVVFAELLSLCVSMYLFIKNNHRYEYLGEYKLNNNLNYTENKSLE